MPKFHLFAAGIAIAAGLSGCATMPQPVGAARLPMAVGADHYSGTWLEIARRPMMITNNCVAGYTTYRPGKTAEEVAVEDGCHVVAPNGKLKAIHGRGVLVDAETTKARLRVHYPFFITYDYWVLYEAPDHSWFISADPNMKNLWIYARTAPSDQARSVMVAKAAELGYDTRQLEFPAQ